MKIHELKTAPDVFDAVWCGLKTAEFRKNDRDFQVGDWLWLRDWDGTCYCASVAAEITHIVFGPNFGIPEGFAMLSFNPSRAGYLTPAATLVNVTEWIRFRGGAS